MQSDTSPFGLRGFLIDAPEFGTLRSRPNGAVIIDNGRISEIGDYDDLRRLRPNSIRWIDRRGAAIFPGLIDCHTHLPQYSVVARRKRTASLVAPTHFPGRARVYRTESARRSAAVFSRAGAQRHDYGHGLRRNL